MRTVTAKAGHLNQALSEERPVSGYSLQHANGWDEGESGHEELPRSMAAIPGPDGPLAAQSGLDHLLTRKNPEASSGPDRLIRNVHSNRRINDEVF